ncbi:sensor histidine kinase [Nocardioides coralli]|uniref:sensor histidine kinase n=1 Tax=Nocardioides coralli TaxID=2872154 RepID=UPI001CA3BBFB|nr:HAMP domain-containing sensor histidine kinase [Nocardioides coralli]QZY30245.1 HAMP domain-containing histidine kinase [Nocardioides coralli]
MNGTGTDVSELTKEELVAELSATLEELSRTRDERDLARNRLVANVSQDLRTPLASIQGYVELLEDGELGRLSPTTLSAVRTIGRNAERLASLLDDLLRPPSDKGPAVPSELAALDLVDLDLGELVRQSQSALESVARLRELDLTVSVAPHLRRVKADRERIEQVILVLVGNALKYTPSGGRISVTAQAAPEGVALTVVDNGIGISAEDLRALFAPEVRSSLVTAKEIVDRHDGRLVVDSTEGAGTTVRVTLPAHPGDQGGFAAWRRSHPSPRNGSTNGTNP